MRYLAGSGLYLPEGPPELQTSMTKRHNAMGARMPRIITAIAAAVVASLLPMTGLADAGAAASPSRRAPVDVNAPRQFSTVAPDVGCGSLTVYVTQRGDWLWAIVRDYLRQYQEGSFTNQDVREYAGWLYDQNPAAFRGSPDRLRVGRSLTLSGIITSCGGPAPSTSPPTTTSHPDPLVIRDCFSDQPRPHDCVPVLGPTQGGGQSSTTTATTVIHYDPSSDQTQLCPAEQRQPLGSCPMPGVG
jgi:hypothetical protein